MVSLWVVFELLNISSNKIDPAKKRFMRPDAYLPFWAQRVSGPHFCCRRNAQSCRRSKEIERRQMSRLRSYAIRQSCWFGIWIRYLFLIISYVQLQVCESMLHGKYPIFCPSGSQQRGASSWSSITWTVKSPEGFLKWQKDLHVLLEETCSKF